MIGNEWRGEEFPLRQDFRLPKRPADKQAEDHFHFCYICQDYTYHAETCSTISHCERRDCSQCGGE